MPIWKGGSWISIGSLMAVPTQLQCNDSLTEYTIATGFIHKLAYIEFLSILNPLVQGQET